MIFCPTLTLATAKDEMKAIRDCQRRQRDSPCDHAQAVVHCFPRVESRPKDSLAVSLKRYLSWEKPKTYWTRIRPVRKRTLPEKIWIPVCPRNVRRRRLIPSCEHPCRMLRF